MQCIKCPPKRKKIAMNNKIYIRKAVISDARDICFLNSSSLGYDYDLAKTEAKLKKIISDGSQAVFVADICNKVVGYIHIADYDVIYADNYKNILGIAVDNNYKRQGIGTALLTAAEKWAEENGAVGVRLVSGCERVDAHKFYIALGYSDKKLQKNFKKDIVR